PLGTEYRGRGRETGPCRKRNPVLPRWTLRTVDTSGRTGPFICSVFAILFLYSGAPPHLGGPMTRVRSSGEARLSAARPACVTSRPRDPGFRAGKSRFRVMRAEGLEQRTLLSVFTVTTTADSGPGSLRQAILDANDAPGPDEVHFDIPGAAGAV